MALISSIDDIRKHVAVAASMQFPDIEPYIGQAIDQFTVRYVGNLHETLSEPAEDDPAKVHIDRVRHLLQNAVSNFAMYIYVPVGSVIFDSSGMSNVENQNRSPISWQQANDIRRSMLLGGHIAMDYLLEHLEDHKELFPEWSSSTYYTESKELLVNNTKAFDDIYHIFRSRQTYLALIPSMKQVEDQYISTLICPELLTHLKAQEHTGIKEQVKSYLQKAIVSFTVAKVATEGLFLINGSGLRIKFDSLSTDKVTAVDRDTLMNTAERQEANGRNYLALAKKAILANPDVFNQCTSPIITADDSAGIFPYNKGGVLSL